MGQGVGESFFVTSLRPRKPHTKRMEPSFFFTRITGAFHGDAEGRMMLFANISDIFLRCRDAMHVVFDKVCGERVVHLL